MQKEQRRHQRIRVSRPVEIVLSGGSRVQAKMIDLSISGLALVYGAPAKIGAKLTVCFRLPMKTSNEMIKVKAVVRHDHFSGNNHVIGMEFLDIPEQ